MRGPGVRSAARCIGIYPGTFDPVHSGHLAFAQATLRACRLDEVVFLPERKPRGKPGATDVLHRIALIKRATKNSAPLRVASLPSPRFTVKDTLPELRAMFGNARLTLLLGSDVARTLPHWEDLDALLAAVSFAVGMRANDSPDEITAAMRRAAQKHSAAIHFTHVYAPDAGLTSSQIRSGAVGWSQLHPGVAAYVREHGLYYNCNPK